jgi:hypothetical protein
MPIRVKLERSKGWIAPENTVRVDRKSDLGTPFKINPVKREWEVVWKGEGPVPTNFQPTKCTTKYEAHEVAVRWYRAWILHPGQAKLLNNAQCFLMGTNLACWCELDLPCHADVLLELIEEFRQRYDEAREADRVKWARMEQLINELPRTQAEWDEKLKRMQREMEERFGPNIESSLKILGLTPPVTRLEIRTAYLSLAKVLHPDVGGNADEFRRINTAYRAALGLA